MASFRGTDESVDVAVLGGGPAGAAATRLLAETGHRVVLLTRPAPGPPLAESLTPSCSKLLERVGVRDAMDGADFVRSSGHTVRWETDAERVELFAGGELGWQVRRDRFDRLLVSSAKAAGAEIHRHASVRAVEQGEDQRVRVAYEERGRARHLVARWVVDATGRSGLMSRSGSGRTNRGPRTVAIVGLWERRPRWPLANPSHTHVESYPGGWAWSVPVSPTRRQVTVMLDPTRTDVAGGNRLRITYREELARTTMIRELTRGARFLGSPWARDASSYECANAAYGRILVAGDAASFVDPLSSFGVKKALASGWLAAVVVHSVLMDPPLAGPALGLFAARDRAMVAGLKRQLQQLAGDAAAAYPGGFWADRAGTDVVDDAGEPNVSALRLDPDVRAAFDQIRSRPSLGLHAVEGVRREVRATVLDRTVVLREHLVVPAFPDGLRYVRNVDLVVLAGLATTHDQVPALFDAYCASAPPVSLPDLLGALAVLVGKGILRFA